MSSLLINEAFIESARKAPDVAAFLDQTHGPVSEVLMPPRPWHQDKRTGFVKRLLKQTAIK